MSNIGDLAKPFDSLINKVAEAIGGWFAPCQIIRIAKADAAAAIIRAQSDIQVTDLHRRAIHRFVEEEAQRQANMEEIMNQASGFLKTDANPSAMENDWVVNFFDKSRICSDKQMQHLWAIVLAGEANTPGTYSKRTINAIGDLDKHDAEMFLALCGFGWAIDGQFYPLVFNTSLDIYRRNNVNFDNMSHLESIGLIKFWYNSGFTMADLAEKIEAVYFSNKIQLTIGKEHNSCLMIGVVMLTQVGYELASVCEPIQVPGFYEYVKSVWGKYSPMDILDTGMVAP